MTLPYFCQQIDNTIQLADSMGSMLGMLTFMSLLISLTVGGITFRKTKSIVKAMLAGIIMEIIQIIIIVIARFVLYQFCQSFPI